MKQKISNGEKLSTYLRSTGLASDVAAANIIDSLLQHIKSGTEYYDKGVRTGFAVVVEMIERKDAPDQDALAEQLRAICRSAA